MYSRDELIWASGLFEGEGCITVCARNITNLPHITLSSADEDVVWRFYKAVGSRGSIILRTRNVGTPAKHKARPHKPLWQWSLSSFEGVQAVVAMLWFGLGKRRRARAKELLQGYLASKRARHLSTSPRAEEMRRYREKHREQINARRRKGDPRRLQPPPSFL